MLSNHAQKAVLARSFGSTERVQGKPSKTCSFCFVLGAALSVAVPIYAQSPSIDAPTGVTRDSRNVSGRPMSGLGDSASIGDSNIAAEAQKDRSRSVAGSEDHPDTGHVGILGSAEEKIEGRAAISRSLEASPTGTSATRADKSASQQSASAMLKDAIALCERLAGTEREICLQQARENRDRAQESAIGATPGSGSIVTRGGAPAKPDDPRGGGMR